MPESQDRRKARRTSRKTAGETSGTADPGHARARRISAERSEVKARGSASAKVYGRGTNAAGRREDDEQAPEAAGGAAVTDAERLRRRARFLRERSEAMELRERVQPRRTRSARLRQALRMRTFRW